MVDPLEIARGLGVYAVASSPGWFVVWIGYTARRVRKQIQEQAGTEPGIVSPGPAKVTGIAEPGDAGTVTSPFTGTESLAYESEIVIERPGDSNLEVLNESDRQPFRLAGTTEDAHVDPEEFELLLTDDFDVTIEGRDDAPPEIRDYLDDAPPEVQRDLDEHGESDFLAETRFVERRLEPGEEAVVVGEATRETLRGTGTVTRVRKGGDTWWNQRSGLPLVLSNENEREILREQLASAEVWIVLGCFWLLFCLLFGAPPVIDGLS